MAERRRAPVEGELERGATLGRYLVLSRLGAGGMGVVYAAYDPELDRKVALKLLRAGRSPDGRVRLLREAQAMARLAHPNVIAVHDVGTLGDEVFVAMEFVDGPTLAELAATEQLPWRRALDLYLQAGQGLAAAHSAGIVHRDFKPQNALVGKDGRVRVLDFGLARGSETAVAADAAADPLPDSAAPRGLLATPLTRAGSRMGTPGYMSPEQFDGRQADAASDQFSFCVALYEALYGERPFSGDNLSELMAAVAAGRPRAEPPHNAVPKWLRGVLLRGLCVRPADRYASMQDLLAALAADPLAARRRRWRWAAAATGVAAVAAGVILAQQRQSQLGKGAERRLTGVWDEGRESAVRRAFLATKLPYAEDAWRGVERVLAGYAQGWAAMRTEACAATRLRGEQSEELLDLRMECLDRRLQELDALAGVFATADAGVVKKSVPAAFALTPLDGCANAAELRAVVKPPRDPALQRRVAQLHLRTARAKALSEAGKYEESDAAATEAAAAASRLGYRPLEAEALFERAFAENKLAQDEAAGRSFEEALIAALAGRDDAVAIDAAAGLVASVGYRQAKYADGERWGRYALALLERVPDDARLGGIVHTQLGVLYMGEGKYEQGIAEQRQALRLREKALGPAHPDTGRTLNNLAAALIESGRNAEAVPYLERALRIKEQTLGLQHPDLSSTLINLAVSLSNLDRVEEAIGYAQRALALDERTLGPEHPSVSMSLGNLSSYYEQLDRHQEAIATARRALAISEKAYGPDHPDVAYKLSTLGDALLGQGDAKAAELVYRRSLAIREAHLQRDHPETAFSLTGLGRALVVGGRAPQAIPYLRRAIAIRTGKDVGSAVVAESRFVLAQALWETGERAEARALAEQAYQGLLGETSSRYPKLQREMEGWMAPRGIRAGRAPIRLLPARAVSRAAGP